jgi:hypothetical protein
VSPIERAARALIDVDRYLSGHHQSSIDYMMPKVRAVLEALREPSDEIVAAGYAALCNGDSGSADAADCHRAMIDALIKEAAA